MPLLREHATPPLPPADARALAEALQGIRGPADGAEGRATLSLAVSGSQPVGSARRGAVAKHASQDAPTIALTAEVQSAVLDLLQRFADGHGVVVGSTDALLTTSQAAEVLGISATYLLRLANEGVIPVEYRGTHRRFTLTDTLAYLEVSRAAKAQKKKGAETEAETG